MEDFKITQKLKFKDGSSVKWVYKPTRKLRKCKKGAEILIITATEGPITGIPIVLKESVILMTRECPDRLIRIKDILGWIYSPREFLRQRIMQ